MFKYNYERKVMLILNIIKIKFGIIILFYYSRLFLGRRLIDFFKIFYKVVILWRIYDGFNLVKLIKFKNLILYFNFRSRFLCL